MFCLGNEALATHHLFELNVEPDIKYQHYVLLQSNQEPQIQPLLLQLSFPSMHDLPFVSVSEIVMPKRPQVLQFSRILELH